MNEETNEEVSDEASEEVSEVDNWHEDLLDRKKDADFLTKYISERYSDQEGNESFVLNINAEWGFGKTFFLNKWKDDLSSIYPVIYYDAWKNDYSKSPLTTFLYEFKEQLSDYYINDLEEFNKIAKGLLVTAFKVAALLAHPSGREIVEEVYDTFIEEQETIRKEIKSFSLEINKIGEYFEKKNDNYDLPIYVMIDEMDRCRPSFSIELLETIKHLFCSKYICFIVATDSRQLEKSIKVIYGSEFDSSKYLNRFFDHEYSLSEPENIRFAEYLMNDLGLEEDIFFTPLENMAVTFSLLADYFRLPLREQKKSASLLEAVKYTGKDGVTDNAKDIDMFYLLFLIMLKLKNKNAYNGYEQSKNKTEFLKNNVYNSLDYNNALRVPTKRYQQDQAGYSERMVDAEIEVAEILTKYNNLLDFNLLNEDCYPDKQSLGINRNIHRRLWSQRPTQYTSGSHIISDLGLYIQIVNQVGQLTY